MILCEHYKDYTGPPLIKAVLNEKDITEDMLKYYCSKIKTPKILEIGVFKGEFLEYQYTADDIGLFTGYTIKIIMSGTNQAYPPIIKDFNKPVF